VGGQLVQDEEFFGKQRHELQHLEANKLMRSLSNYYRWVYELFSPDIGKRILDAGCGIGNFTGLLSQTADYVLAVDRSLENIKELKRRFETSPVVEVARLDLEHDFSHLKAKAFDTIVCLDVLEHVQDDIALLRKFKQIVVPNGKLLVKVPACPRLFGSIDVASGHYRRYTLAELREKAKVAGWQPIRLEYMNIWGIAPYFLKCLLLKSSANFSRTFAPWQLKVIRVSIPILKRLDRLLGPPIGQSVIMVACASTDSQVSYVDCCGGFDR